MLQNDVHIINKELVTKILPKRIQDSHKGTYGYVLNIAGSCQYSGAAFLSSLSALKVGAGYCALATCSDVINTVASNTPDITYIDLGQSEYGTIPKDANKYIVPIASFDVVSIGCGLNSIGGTAEFAYNFIKKNKGSYTPMVIDADAINICASQRIRHFPLNSIITPHPRELSRLMGLDIADILQNKVKIAKEAAKEYNCIVLLKGHESIIATPSSKVYVNHTGNSALSKAGSGDVLTGMISGLCAQGISLEDAVCCAVYIHGLASEIASRAMSEYCVLASDLLKYIPLAFKALPINA